MAQAIILKVLEQPTVEPISLDEAKDQIRRPRTYTVEDEYIQFLIMAARTAIENKLGHSFHEQKLRWTLDAWPCEPVIELPRATPLISVESITYRDYYGTTTTWPDTEYDIDLEGMPGRIAPKGSRYFPIVLLAQMAAIQITYKAGIANNSSPAVAIPANNRHAIKWLLGHMYRNRESISIGTLMEGKELPQTIDWILSGKIYAF